MDAGAGGDEIKFIDAKPFVRQNVFKSLDPKTGRPTYDETKVPGTGKRADFCPSLWGGKDWPPVAYNPQTRLMYIPANENLCGYLEGKQTEYEPGQLYIGVAISDIGMTVHPGADHIGELQAWNLDTGQKVWTQKFEKSQNWGPVLTTGGGLVFMGGTNDRFFRAFDAKTGDKLWETRTNSGVTGVPVSYEVDGVQYVAVQSGWGVDAQRKQEKLAQLGYATLDVPRAASSGSMRSASRSGRCFGSDRCREIRRRAGRPRSWRAAGNSAACCSGPGGTAGTSSTSAWSPTGR